MPKSGRGCIGLAKCTTSSGFCRSRSIRGRRRPPPSVVFGAIALIPVIELALRPALPLGVLEGHRDLFTVITVMSVLPLLIARLAVERDEARASEDRRRLLSAPIEHADHLVLI